MSDTGTRDRRATSSRRRLALAVAVVVLLVAGALVWYFFIRDDSPAPFDIDDATVQVDDGPSTVSAGADGAWVVAAGSGSEAGFRVDEELASIGAATAVGRTEDVSARLTIDGTTISDAQVDVDMTTLATDDSRRDGRMRDALAVDEFPTSSFALTEPIELDAVPADGGDVSVTAAGDMTIKGVTNPVEVTLDARLVDDTVVVVGSLPVVFADYGIEAPTAPVVVSVEDHGTVEFQLFFTRE